MSKRSGLFQGQVVYSKCSVLTNTRRRQSGTKSPLDPTLRDSFTQDTFSTKLAIVQESKQSQDVHFVFLCSIVILFQLAHNVIHYTRHSKSSTFPLSPNVPKYGIFPKDSRLLPVVSRRYKRLIQTITYPRLAFPMLLTGYP